MCSARIQWQKGEEMAILRDEMGAEARSAGILIDARAILGADASGSDKGATVSDFV